MNITFGRKVEHDPRSRGFPMPRMVLLPTLREKYWNAHAPLDQGNTPMCVGYSGFGWLLAGPVTNREVPFTPADLYHWAQARDEWEGEDYDGTSALGLMKALKEKGYVIEYRWAFDVETIFNWLLSTGPVLMGTSWLSGMMSLDEHGYLNVSGSDYGGHEYMLVGANLNKHCPDGTVGAVRMLNSWGNTWGQHGRAWISRGGLTELMNRQGDCVSATEIDLDPKG